jgi:hypothetical protein
MRHLSLLPSSPFFPTASELRIASECVAPWALGLPEAQEEPGEWAEKGKRLHGYAEAVAKDLMEIVPSSLPISDQCIIDHLTYVIAMDRLAAVKDRQMTWFVEQGIKWRPDGFADEAEFCDRQPGERLRGWFSGTVDLAYVRADGVLVIVDWKFGPRESIEGEPAEDSCQGHFLALAFASKLGIRGSSAGVVVARFERRMVNEEGVEVDACDITQGELDAFAEQLRGLAKRIMEAQGAKPRISHACGKCKAKAECPAQMALETSVMAEVQGANIEALMRPPQSPDDARALHFAIKQGEHLTVEWKRWLDAYVLTKGPVAIGLGLELKALPQSKRAVVNTPESMDLIESVAGKGAIVVERSATCDSIKKAVRDEAGKGIESTADRNKAKAKAEADAFAKLIEGGAIRESGKTYVVREVRANETEE